MREGKGLVTGWNEKGYPFHNQIPRLNASLSQPRGRGFKSQDDQGRPRTTKDELAVSESISCLTLYTLTSVCTFSFLFPIHFLGAGKENLFNNQKLL